MEAVGADLHQERVDQHLGEAVAMMLVQRIAEGGEVGEEFGGASIGCQGGVGRDGDGGLRRRPQTHHDACDQQTDGLVWEPFFKSVLASGAELREVTMQEGGEFGRDRDLLGRTRKLFKDILQASAVVGQDERVGHAEGLARGLGGDEGVAVAVAADP